MQKLEAHAVVVGAGISGLVTALRLAELGIKPMVLERGTEDKYPCNTRIAGGAFHVAHQDLVEQPGRLIEAITARTGDSASRDLVEALASDAGPAANWLKQMGVRFIRAGQESGDFRHDIDPVHAVVSIVGQVIYAFMAQPIIQGVLLQRGTTGPDAVWLREFGVHAAEFSLRALAPDPLPSWKRAS